VNSIIVERQVTGARQGRNEDGKVGAIPRAPSH